jgi:hypothetical protein
MVNPGENETILEAAIRAVRPTWGHLGLDCFLTKRHPSENNGTWFQGAF